MRHGTRWAGLVLTLVMAGCQAPTTATNSTGSPSPAPGTASVPATPPTPNGPAADVTFLDQNNAQHKLSEYKGKFIVLTEWAEWCPHCQKQLPLIQKELYDKYTPRGVAFVNVEASHATVEDVANFAKNLGVTMPLFHDDTAKSTQTAYPLQGFPTTSFITPDFQFIKSVSGELPIADYEAVFTPYLK